MHGYFQCVWTSVAQLQAFHDMSMRGMWYPSPPSDSSKAPTAVGHNAWPCLHLNSSLFRQKRKLRSDSNHNNHDSMSSFSVYEHVLHAFHHMATRVQRSSSPSSYQGTNSCGSQCWMVLFPSQLSIVKLMKRPQILWLKLQPSLLHGYFQGE